MKTILIVLFFSMLLSACKKVEPITQQVDQNPAAEMGGFEKIGQAIRSGEPVTCTIAKKDGTSAMTYSTKAKKLKMSGMKSEGISQTTSLISDGDFLYSWDESTKKGVKMKIPSEEELQTIAEKQGQTVPSLQSKEDFQKYEDQGYTVQCEVSTISDTEFLPPTDVEFSDLSAVMENATQLLQKKPATSSAQSSEEMQKQIQEMMKQYQNQ